MSKIGEAAVEPLIEALKDGIKNEDINTIQHTAETLANMNEKRVADFLIEVLKHENPKIRLNYGIIRILEKIGDKRAIEPIIDILSETDLFTLKQLFGVLSKIDREWVKHEAAKKLVPFLIDMIDSLDKDLEDLKENCIALLAGIGDKRAIEPLVALLKTESDSSMLKTIKNTLKELGWEPENIDDKVFVLLLEKNEDELVKLGEPAIEPLVDILINKETFTWVAVSVLRKLGWEPETFEEKICMFIQNKKYNDSIQLGKTDPEKFVDLMKNKSSSKSKIMRMMHEMKDPETFEILNVILEKDDKNTKVSAARILGEIGDDRAIEPIIKAFEGYPREMSRTAIGIISKIGGPKAVEGLLELLENKDDEVVKTAIKMLGETGDPKVIEPLIKKLQSCGDACYEINETLTKLGEPAVEPLMKVLKGDNIKTRQIAIEILGNLKVARAVEPIIDALKDKEVRSRYNAMRALIKIGDKRAIEPFVSIIENEMDDRFKVETIKGLDGLIDKSNVNLIAPLTKIFIKEELRNKFETARVLSKLSDDWADNDEVRSVVPELIQNLEVKDDGSKINFIQKYSIKLLGMLKDKRATLPIITFLKNLKGIPSFINPREFQKDAIYVLGELRDERAKEYLIELLEDKSITEYKRASIEIAISKIDPDFKKDTDKKETKKTEPKEKKLTPIEGEIAKHALALQKTYYGDREEAVLALSRIDDPKALEHIIFALDDEDYRVRGKAAKTLTNCGWKPTSKDDEMKIVIALNIARVSPKPDEIVRLGESAFKQLAKVIKDSGFTQYSAADRLIKINSSRAVEIINDRLKEKRVYKYTCRLLGELGDKRSVEPLINMLKYDMSDVRSAAAFALGKIGDSRAVEPLIKALGDADVRSDAIVSLGRIGDPRAVEPLILILNDTDSSLIKEDILWALGTIGDPRATEPLITALKDKSVRVREKAAIALARIGDVRAIEPLESALKIEMEKSGKGDPERRITVGVGKTPTLDVIKKALETLKTKNSDEMKSLIERLSSSDPKELISAAGSIEKMGDAAIIATDGLIKLIKNEDKSVRLTAIDVLCKIW